MKQSSLETKSQFLTKEQKEQHHKKDIDPKWQSIIERDEDRQRFRTIIYQLWGLVLAGVDESIDVAKIITNPYTGNYHISQLKSEYSDYLTEFMNYIACDQSGGNVTKLSASLVKWFDSLQKIIKQSPPEKLEEDVRKYAEENSFIQKIRENIGLKKPETTPTPITEIKTTKTTSKTISKPKTKPKKSPSFKDIFLEGLIAEIEGNDEKAIRLFEQSIDMSYKQGKFKQTGTVDKMILQNYILGSMFISLLNHHQKESDKAAFEYTKKMADFNNPHAQNNLAICYLTGTEDVVQDHQEAIRLFRLAANQGLSIAQYNLGISYKDGIGVTQNLTEAVRLFRLAAAQDFSEAQFYLGSYYENGIGGIAPDFTEAAKWYKLAADGGNKFAQYNLGDFYLSGKGVTKNYEEAVKYLRLAVEQNSPQAQDALGTCYEQGFGVDKNLEEAIKLYRLAAKQKEPSAQYNLARHLQHKNIKEAFENFKLAAEQGHYHAQHALGIYYEHAKGVEKNNLEAVKWYKLAAEQGKLEAQLRLGDIYLSNKPTMKGIKKDDTEAAKWYKLAADGGSADAAYEYGRIIIEEQDNEEQDNKEALKYYKLAADRGLLSAQANLVTIYRTGLYTEIDYCEAKKYLDLLGEKGTSIFEEEIISAVQKNAEIERKIKIVHGIIKGNFKPENLKKITDLYNECSKYIKDTHVQFRLAITNQYNEIEKFFADKERSSPSPSTTATAATTPLKQSSSAKQSGK